MSWWWQAAFGWRDSVLLSFGGRHCIRSPRSQRAIADCAQARCGCGGTMANARNLLKVWLPMYGYPRNAWRRKTHQAVSVAPKKAGVRYTADDRFALTIRLYLEGSKLERVDIDNRRTVSAAP